MLRSLCPLQDTPAKDQRHPSEEGGEARNVQRVSCEEEEEGEDGMEKEVWDRKAAVEIAVQYRLDHEPRIPQKELPGYQGEYFLSHTLLVPHPAQPAASHSRIVPGTFVSSLRVSHKTLLNSDPFS